MRFSFWSWQFSVMPKLSQETHATKCFLIASWKAKNFHFGSFMFHNGIDITLCQSGWFCPDSCIFNLHRFFKHNHETTSSSKVKFTGLTRKCYLYFNLFNSSSFPEIKGL